MRWRDSERKKKEDIRSTLFYSWENLDLPEDMWCLESSPSKSLVSGLISSAASPSPGRIPFDQAWSSAERGVHLLAPLSLSWPVAACAPILQQQEEMKEVSSTGTLSGQGQCSDPRKLAPDLAECACLLPCCCLTASDGWENGQDCVVKHQSHLMKNGDVFFFFFPLVAACVCSCFNNYNFF